MTKRKQGGPQGHRVRCELRCRAARESKGKIDGRFSLTLGLSLSSGPSKLTSQSGSENKISVSFTRRTRRGDEEEGGRNWTSTYLHSQAGPPFEPPRPLPPPSLWQEEDQIDPRLLQRLLPKERPKGCEEERGKEGGKGELDREMTSEGRAELGKKASFSFSLQDSVRG